MSRRLQVRDVTGPIEATCREFLAAHDIPIIYLRDLTRPLLDEVHALMDRRGTEAYEDGRADDRGKVSATTTEWATRIYNTDGTFTDGQPVGKGNAETARDGLNMDENADFRARKGIDRSVLVSRMATDYSDGSRYLSAWQEEQ